MEARRLASVKPSYCSSPPQVSPVTLTRLPPPHYLLGENTPFTAVHAQYLHVFPVPIIELAPHGGKYAVHPLPGGLVSLSEHFLGTNRFRVHTNGLVLYPRRFCESALQATRTRRDIQEPEYGDSIKTKLRVKKRHLEENLLTGRDPVRRFEPPAL